MSNPNSPTKNCDVRVQSPNDQSDLAQVINPAGGEVMGGFDYQGFPYGNCASGGGGLTEVVHDSTLSGEGNSLSPLSVVSNSNLIANGLIAEYQILPTETAGALVDYSGNGNNATGTVGTAPSVLSGTGGVQFVGTGAILLPAALNSALTVQFFVSFHNADSSQPYQSLIQGNSTTFSGGIGNIQGLCLYGGPSAASDDWGAGVLAGGHRPRTMYQGNSFGASTIGVMEGIGTVAVTYGTPSVTQDSFYLNGILQRNVQTTGTAGLQTNGVYQLGGCASGAGLQFTPTYMTGTVYYALFYNRVLTSGELLQNHNVMAAAMSLRGVNVMFGGNCQSTGLPDLTPQMVFRGDSITAGFFGQWEQYLTVNTVGVTGFASDNQGLPGDSLTSDFGASAPYEVDTLYRGGAAANIAYNALGTNDSGNAPMDFGYMRSWCISRRETGFKTLVASLMNRGGGASPSWLNQFNNMIRQYWPTFADGFVDLGSLPNLGADSASANTVYFGDQLHPTALSNQFLLAPQVSRAINRVYGNMSYSAANTATSIGAPAFVQTNSVFPGTGTSLSIAFNSPNTAGNLLIFGTDGGTVSGITDSNGNTWALLQTGRGAGTGNGNWWYAHDCVGGSNTLTVTYGTNSYCRGTVAEYSGVSGAYTFKNNANSGGSAGTSVSSGSITTTANGSLVLGLGFDNSGGGITYTQEATWTLDRQAASTSNTSCWLEHKVQTSAGSITATGTASGTSFWDETVVSFSPPANTTLYVMQDADVYLKANPANASFTVQLPQATGMSGQNIHIKNTQTTGSNTVTLVPQPLAITNAVANGATVTFTVPNTYNLQAGMTITVSGCTTTALNTTYTITSVGTTTVVCPSTQSVTEAETAQLICEYIDGGVSTLLANNASITLQSVFVKESTGGCNWMSI